MYESLIYFQTWNINQSRSFQKLPETLSCVNLDVPSGWEIVKWEWRRGGLKEHERGKLRCYMEGKSGSGQEETNYSEDGTLFIVLR